jgi:hypothetical protein
VILMTSCAAAAQANLSGIGWSRKLCYLEIYRSLLHFSIPCTGSTQHWFWEFKQWKLIKKVYLQHKICVTKQLRP